MPRWFTEGLSEYETLIARPEWRRENDADLYGALANNTLPSIGDLNSEFMQPDANAVVVAYFLSAVTIEWLAQTYGFPKLVDALKLYGKGKETPEVLKTITGKTIAQLDAAEHGLGRRLQPHNADREDGSAGSNGERVQHAPRRTARPPRCSNLRRCRCRCRRRRRGADFERAFDLGGELVVLEHALLEALGLRCVETAGQIVAYPALVGRR